MEEKKKEQVKQGPTVNMQDSGPKATQEDPDEAEKFHVEQSGPGMTSTRVPDDMAGHTPGMTSRKATPDD